MAFHSFKRTSSLTSIYVWLALYVLYCAKNCHSACQQKPTTLSHIGNPTLTDCIDEPGNALTCSVRCSSSTSCKVVLVTSCDQSGKCNCSYCNQLTQVDMSNTNFRFFLHTQEIGRDTNHVIFSNQLTAGRPLLARIFIKGTRILLSFISTVGHVAFRIEIRFDEWSVIANSYIGYTWGTEDRYTPQFNFHQGQTISMFCVVNPTAYYLYFDNVLYKVFGHRIGIDYVSDFVVSDSSTDESYIIWFRR